MSESALPMGTLKVLVVDDEALARARLRTLLSDCKAPGVHSVSDASNAVHAMEHLQHQQFDVLLLDIHMPGTDGLALARMLQKLPEAPALIFVTAHAEYALQAFELEATDYLTKPVRLERLQAALQKVARRMAARGVVPAEVAHEEALIIQERGRTVRVPLRQVVYFKAELKYVTVRTATRSHLFDGSLNELEAKYPQQFLRIHRNALIARGVVRSLEKHFEAEEGEGEGWAVRLDGVDEPLAVSRRQLAAVRALVKG